MVDWALYIKNQSIALHSLLCIMIIIAVIIIVNIIILIKVQRKAKAAEKSRAPLHATGATSMNLDRQVDSDKMFHLNEFMVGEIIVNIFIRVCVF